jgi:hypothetical protein
MKIGEVWERKNFTDISWGQPDYGISHVTVANTDKWKIVFSPGDLIYIAAKSGEDNWEVWYLRNVEENYDKNKKDFDEFGSMNLVDGVWEEIEQAHNNNASHYFLDNGEKPSVNENYTNNKYVLSSGEIYSKFIKKDGILVHLGKF